MTLMLVAVSAFSNDCQTMEEDTFVNHTRPFVCFNHDEHNAAAELEDNCAFCHHVVDENGKLVEGESSEDSPCSECHSDAKDPKQMDLMNKFHKRCRGCHLEQKKGPVTCGECHVKNR